MNPQLARSAMTRDPTGSSGTASIIRGGDLAAEVRETVTDDARALAARRGHPPGLATILVGDDPASAVYVAGKRRACEQVGFVSFHHPLSRDVAPETLCALIEELNHDERVDGILCQLPLPAHLDADEIINRISPDKDVDGLTLINVGRLAVGVPGLRPCTPLGVMRILDHLGVTLRGRRAVVVGYSNLVGKPMARLLLAAEATVTSCHIHTKGVRDFCREAEVLVVAVGRPGLIPGDWIRPGAIVIDVGITRTASGLVGDVCFEEAEKVASAITPVPGGVGPMTIAMLLSNTLQAARRQVGSAGSRDAVNTA